MLSSLPGACVLQQIGAIEGLLPIRCPICWFWDPKPKCKYPFLQEIYRFERTFHHLIVGSICIHMESKRRSVATLEGRFWVQKIFTLRIVALHFNFLFQDWQKPLYKCFQRRNYWNFDPFRYIFSPTFSYSKLIIVENLEGAHKPDFNWSNSCSTTTAFTKLIFAFRNSQQHFFYGIRRVSRNK